MKKHNQLTLGSLFDGIGGFPYAGSFLGIKPLWASEIMPQAISVTQRLFTDMEHVGDITTLDGAKLPPVDIITFGSPCQDLSVAGKRAGLDGERSGLFSEAIRIIDEMRRATNGKYPRYAIWENVPGALSSGNPRGSDFRAVLEAFTKTKIPMPVSEKWANAGMVRGGGVDLAWCVYNAQYFGVPQRRRRIFLVCDFGGRSAAEILFIPKSLQWYFETLCSQGQGVTTDAERSTGGAGGKNCLNPWDNQQARIFTENGLSPTLAGADGGGGRNPGGLVCTTYGLCGENSNSMKSANPNSGIYEAESSRTLDSNGGNPCCNQGGMLVVAPKVAAFLSEPSAKARSIAYSEEVAPTLKSEAAPCVCECMVINDQGGDSISVEKSEISPTLRSETHGNLPIVGVHQGQGGDVNISDTAYSLSTNGNASGRNAPLVAHPKVTATLVASGAGVSRPGGMGSETDLCVVYSLQGNMIGRQDHNGPAGNGINEELAFTLNATDVNGVAGRIPSAEYFNRQASDTFKQQGVASTQTARQYKDATDLICESFASSSYGGMKEGVGTLRAEGGDNGGGSENLVVSKSSANYIVRRLLPVECERLQGYPDGWTEFGHDNKPISDTRRYQMLGNSVAVPCVAYIMLGIVERWGQYKQRGEEAA